MEAANRLPHKPYVWGGGHTSWSARGYNCSGAIGYVLHAAGLVDVTMVSGQLAYWGEAGAGPWITVHANAQLMESAGLRLDTATTRSR